MAGVLSCLVSDCIGAGQINHEFCLNLAHYLGIRGGIALSSYYAAINLMLDELELNAGDKIILSPLSPQIYLDIFKKRDINPLFADVDTDSAAIDPLEVEKLIPENPQAVLLYYSLGFIPDLDELTQLNIPIIEDISQALGGGWKQKKCGDFGDFTILSLDPPNIITAGGGACVLTKKHKYYSSLKKSKKTKYNLLPDMNAAIGLSQLKQINDLLDIRNELDDLFRQSVMRSNHKALIQKGEGKNTNYSFPVLLSTSLQKVQHYVKKYKVETGLAFGDSIISSNEDIYRSFTNARTLALRCLLFPLYPTLKKSDIDVITKLLAVLP